VGGIHPRDSVQYGSVLIKMNVWPWRHRHSDHLGNTGGLTKAAMQSQIQTHTHTHTHTHTQMHARALMGRCQHLSLRGDTDMHAACHMHPSKSQKLNWKSLNTNAYQPRASPRDVQGSIERNTHTGHQVTQKDTDLHIHHSVASPLFL
jgi:3-deoxy-D-arabino-heptulosonate 7-phosphate (DAHP) synthase